MQNPFAAPFAAFAPAAGAAGQVEAPVIPVYTPMYPSQFLATPQQNVSVTSLSQAVRFTLYINEGKIYNLSPLQIAARIGPSEDLEEMVRRGAPLDPSSDIYKKRAALHDAAIAGRVDNAITLIRLGIPVNITDRRAKTPMHYAAEYGHLEMIQVLAQNGGALDALDDSGSTPLALAAGQDIRDRNMFGLTYEYEGKTPDGRPIPRPIPAYFRFKPGATPSQVIEYLVRGLGSQSLDYPDLDGDTPLNTAAARGNIDAVKTIVNLGSRALDTPNLAGDTPLHVGEFTVQYDVDVTEAEIPEYYQYQVDNEAKKRQEIIEFLITHGVQNIDPINRLGRTPLFRASIAKQPLIIETLIKYGSRAIDEPQYSSNEYMFLLNPAIQMASPSPENTPLMQAVVDGDSEMVALLLRLGSRALGIPNNDGMTPFGWILRQVMVTEVGLDFARELGEEDDWMVDPEDLRTWRDMLRLLRIVGANQFDVDVIKRSSPGVPGEQVVQRITGLLNEPIDQRDIDRIRGEVYFQPLLNRVLDAIIV